MTTPREQVLVDALRPSDAAYLKGLLERFRDFVVENGGVRNITTRQGEPTNHHNKIWTEIADALVAYESPRPEGEDAELVKRLHKYSRSWSERAGSNAICLEAATRIEQLSDEVARLRELQNQCDASGPRDRAPHGAAGSVSTLRASPAIADDEYGDGYTHEAMHAAWMVMDMVARWVIETRAADQFPEFKKRADGAHQALFDAYQMLGATLSEGAAAR